MKQLKTISIVWGLIIIVLFGTLTFFALRWKNQVYPYTELEEQLITTTKKYYESKYQYPAAGESKYISLDELKENNLIESLKKDDDECNGFVKVTMNNVIEYKSYIKCNNYTTKDYDKYIEMVYKK